MLASKVTANEAIRRLRETSGGNFLWTEHALLSLEAGTHRFADLDALPPGLTGLYAAFFERQFPDVASYAPARQVLEVVAAAQQPLTTDQLAGVTGLDPDYELPAVLDRLAVYLPDRDGRRAVHHKSLADWLTETTAPRPAGRFFASLRRGHQRLAACCWTAYQGGVKRMPAYSLRHLPGPPDRGSPLGRPGGRAPRSALSRGPGRGRPDLRPGARFHARWRAAAGRSSAPGATFGWSSRRCDSDLHFLARHPTALFAVPLEPMLVVRLPPKRRPTMIRHPAAGRPKARPGYNPSPNGCRRGSNLGAVRRKKRPHAFRGCDRSGRRGFLSAEPSWPASAGTLFMSRAWRSPPTAAASSAGLLTTRCGCGTRRAARADLPPRAHH